jgi:hypothetical protein
MRPLRLAAAACALLAVACSDVLVGAPAAVDNTSLFDDLWHQFDLHYSYFGLGVNWDSLGTHYRPLATSAATDHEFASVLAAMLAELKDVHVSLSPSGAGSTMRYLSRFDTIATYFDHTTIFQRYVPASNTTPSGHIQFGLIADSVGYIRLRNFDGDGWAGEIDDVIHRLPDARALVIDVRDNPGGNYVLAAAIAGRFADRKRIFGYVRRRDGARHDDFTGYIAETVDRAGTHFGGRVYVLANRRSFSSAEDFVLAMRAIPGVLIVGDTTGGASGGPIVRELANGWTYQLSEWIEYTSDFVGIERVGLAPSVFVKGSATDSVHGTDAVLERTLRLARRP